MYIQYSKAEDPFNHGQFVTHSLEHVGKGDHLVFNLAVEQYYYCVLTT